MTSLDDREAMFRTVFLSVDREREHAKPIEEGARAFIDSEGAGHNDPPDYDDHAPIVQEAYREHIKAVWACWVSHGWITDLGLEAMKKERGME